MSKADAKDPGNVMDFLSEPPADSDPDVDTESGEEDQSAFELDDYDPDHPMYTEPEPDQEPDADTDPQPDAEPAVDEDAPPEGANDKQRYQYWQSRHDKLKKQSDDRLKAMEDQVNAMADQMKGYQGAPQGQQPPPEPTIDEKIAGVQTSLQGLQAPKAPEKPGAYNGADAYTDPDSESFRYQRQMEQYQQERLEFIEKREQLKDEYNELRIKKVEEPAQEAVRSQQVSRQEKALFDHLQNNFKLSQDEAADFVRTFSDPKSMALENLVSFYKFRKGMASPSTPKPKQDGKPNRRPSTVAAPPPIKSGSGSPGTDSPDDHDSFSKGLLSAKGMF